jgi:hypothetical protein
MEIQRPPSDTASVAGPAGSASSGTRFSGRRRSSDHREDSVKNIADGQNSALASRPRYGSTRKG